MVIEFLAQPALWAALGGLGGVLVTLVTKRADHNLDALKVLVDRLEHEVDGLSQRVASLEVERDTLGRRLRATLDWAHKVWRWGHALVELLPDGVEAPPVPEVPHALEDEF